MPQSNPSVLVAVPRRETAAFETAREPTASGPAATSTPPAAVATAGTPTDPYIDDATGLDSRAAWDRVLAEENARYVRYRRPVGVVVAELLELDKQGQLHRSDWITIIYGVEPGH